MSMSKRDRVFKEVMENLKDYFSLPAGEAPVLDIRLNRKFPELNNRTFLCGYAAPNDVANREVGIAFVEMPSGESDELKVQFIVHISPTSVPPDILGVEMGDHFDLTLASALELFGLLKDYLIHWKESSKESKTYSVNKTLH